MPVKVSMIEAGGLGAAWPTGASESGAGAPGWAAGGGAEAPGFGWGAGFGTGTGTVCAIAAAVRPARMIHATAARLALRLASLRAPRPSRYWRRMAISRLEWQRQCP